VDTANTVGNSLSEINDSGVELVKWLGILEQSMGTSTIPSRSDLIKPFVRTITAGLSNYYASDSIASDSQRLEDFASYVFNSSLRQWEKDVTESNCQKDVFKLARQALDARTSPVPDQDRLLISQSSQEWLRNAMHEPHSSDAAARNTAVDTIDQILRVYTHEGAVRFFNILDLVSTNRKFFVTEKGYMGIGPNSMQPTDIVCVLFGGKTPFVLRPTSTPNEYLLLGECYVYGLMDGEAMDAYERGEIESEWFHLR
jgi:hypothetical protein